MLSIPSLRIIPGEQIAIVGENGAGKSNAGKTRSTYLMTWILAPSASEAKISGTLAWRVYARNLLSTPRTGAV